MLMIHVSRRYLLIYIDLNPPQPLMNLFLINILFSYLKILFKGVAVTSKCKSKFAIIEFFSYILAYDQNKIITYIFDFI